MNMELLSLKQSQAINGAVDRYAVSKTFIQEVLDYADSVGNYVISYEPHQEAFFLSDGEPYTLEGIRKSRTIF